MSILTYNNKVVLNPNQTHWVANSVIPIPAYTTRFLFAQPQTEQSLASCGYHNGNGGYWTRINDVVWQYTYESNSWAYEFKYSQFSGLLPECMIVGGNLGPIYTDAVFYGQTNITQAHLNSIHHWPEEFSGCTSLTAVKIDATLNCPNSNSYSGDPITYFEIGEFDGSSIYGSSAFDLPYCTTFKIGSCPNVTEITNQAFTDVGNNTHSYDFVTITIGDCPNLTSLNQAFQGSRARTIKIGATPLLEDVSYAFDLCSRLLHGVQLDTSNVTNCNHMYHSCSDMIDCPDYDLSSVGTTSNTNVFSSMFESCADLEAVPQFKYYDGLDAAACITGSQMFANCRSLTDGAYRFYVQMSGDRDHWNDVYGAAPLPSPMFHVQPDSNNVFAGSQSTEPGWQYVNSGWKD